MRVLHVYRTYYPDPPGGLQEAIRQIALSTRAVGVSPRIFALSPNPSPQQLDVPEGQVVRARSWWAPASCDISDWSAFRLFSEEARNADLIHYHFPWPFADILHLAVKPRAPAVMTYHSDIVRQRWLGRIYAPVMRKMLGSMAAIVATSQNYARSSLVLAGEGVREKVHVIPLGIDDKSYPPQGDQGVHRRLGLADEAYFLFIGVLRYYKGLHTLVKAAAKVNAKIVIAGSGPEEDALKIQVRELGCTNVLFAGRVTDEEKVALLAGCKAFVLPSHLRSEAFGMVLVEAAMFGKPMVTCEIGTGTSFVNADGETGFVVPPEKPEAFSEAMNCLLHEVGVAERFGHAARQRYERLFSAEALGRSYRELYRQVAGGQDEL